MDRRQFSRLRHGAAAQQGADQNNKSWRQKLKEMKEKNKELSADNNVMKERCSWMKEQIEKKYKKFQEQISALEVSLVEMSRTENSYKKTVAHFYQKHLKALNSDWEKRWSLGQDEAAARLQETQAACNLKVKALEDQLRSNLAAKEVCLQREQELQSQSSKMKEELSDKVSQKEQEIKLLTQQNSDLQVLHLS
uniref:nuclear distribution protein nudE homolog 1-like n=1 Tax=Semicossyphus pulcher TaxID=241346 RepID=UPI0037E84141